MTDGPWENPDDEPEDLTVNPLVCRWLFSDRPPCEFKAVDEHEMREHKKRAHGLVGGEGGPVNYNDKASLVEKPSHRAEKALKALKLPEPEMVNHPNHYGGDTVYEVIKVCEAWELDQDAYLFQAVKYIARAGKKDPTKMVEDLKKARFYLDRRIAALGPNKSIFKVEREFYRKHLSEWINQKGLLGHYVTIAGPEVIAYGKTEVEVYRETVQILGENAHFMLKEIKARE